MSGGHRLWSDRCGHQRSPMAVYGWCIPSCPGVVAFGPTLRECEDTLRATLEDWILVGLKLGHPLPVLAGIDLNGEPGREPVDAL